MIKILLKKKGCTHLCRALCMRWYPSTHIQLVNGICTIANQNAYMWIICILKLHVNTQKNGHQYTTKCVQVKRNHNVLNGPLMGPWCDHVPMSKLNHSRLSQYSSYNTKFISRLAKILAHLNNFSCSYRTSICMLNFLLFQQKIKHLKQRTGEAALKPCCNTFPFSVSYTGFLPAVLVTWPYLAHIYKHKKEVRLNFS